jgi:hypothetical protein
MYAWLLNGVTFTVGQYFDANLNMPDSTGWKLVGTDDIGQDGNPDFVWHNGVTGATQAWTMFNFQRLGYQNATDPALIPTDSSGWRVIRRW